MSLEPRRLLALLFAPSAARLRAVAPSTERGWRELLAQAEGLDATGLAHAALRRTRSTDVAPDDVRSALRLAHATNAAHNLALCAEADRVLAALREADVLAAPMKGVALFSERVVEDLGTRPTGDFDVVTRRRDRDVALRTLHDLGYRARFHEASWKHLPALTRGDLSIEVHEIAYWSTRSRAVFRAEHLTSVEGPARLGRLCALQIHHLVVGSPPDAVLVVRTLADVDAFLQRARRDPATGNALIAAAVEAGLERELAAADGVLAEARDEAPILDLSSATADRDALLAPLFSPPRDARAEALAHALRILPLQPWAVTREMVSLLLFPPPELVATRIGRAPGSAEVSFARVRRPFELLFRIAQTLPQALPGALRARPGRRGPGG